MMKKLIATLMSLFLMLAILAQETTKAGNVTVIEDKDKTIVKIGEDENFVIEESKDTTKIKFGKKGITIIEGKDGTEVLWDDLDEEMIKKIEDKGDENKSTNKQKKFKPHWAGFEVGINNYVNKDFTLDFAPINDYMNLNTGRSWNFNVNFLEYGIGLGTDKIGLVTGLGLEMNNYHFDNGNVITKDPNGNIISYEIQADNVSIQRAKLQTTFLVAPLLLEFQIPAGKKRIFISGGVLGGVKIGSKTKMVYTQNRNKQKDKIKDDFNLNALRYGFTTRIGYSKLKLFANYYPTSLFEKGKGPELYPFSIGLTLLSF